MSDRPVTVAKIAQAATDRGCHVSTMNHLQGNREESFSWEHGPFAGAGLFLDLALASRARHGLVGTRRSSTMLLAELIVYNKVKELQRGRYGDEPFVFCDYERDCKCSTVVDSSSQLNE
jgi:hypothetical protein